MRLVICLIISYFFPAYGCEHLADDISDDVKHDLPPSLSSS
ncbi:hypothetical protein RU86_GL000944 [Lactococcus piscium]|uniref:Uncharacterized protein n=1 Tax=Pseudolactococcus piscium TaxID=1364 RepID=A0A2A5RVN6_9LACT|nr:hypothetical protein RU86_GL000944 [Lactococcus piscium]